MYTEESRMSTSKKYEGKFVTALGWGLADIPHQVCTLRSVNLEIFRSEYCQGEVSTAICAGLNAGGRDACLVIIFRSNYHYLMINFFKIQLFTHLMLRKQKS